jgi:hypothetical protein
MQQKSTIRCNHTTSDSIIGSPESASGTTPDYPQNNQQLDPTDHISGFSPTTGFHTDNFGCHAYTSGITANIGFSSTSGTNADPSSSTEPFFSTNICGSCTNHGSQANTSSSHAYTSGFTAYSGFSALSYIFHTINSFYVIESSNATTFGFHANTKVIHASICGTQFARGLHKSTKGSNATTFGFHANTKVIRASICGTQYARGLHKSTTGLPSNQSIFAIIGF